MNAKLVQIGHSWGIRISKRILEQFNFKDEIEVEIKKEGLLLKKKTQGKKPRSGWKRQILKEIEKNGYPEMLMPDNMQNEFDEGE